MSDHRRVCATMPHHFSLAASDPAYRARRQRIERFTRTARAAARSQVVVIPVVVHVLYRDEVENLSEAQVHSQIDALNQAFRLRNDDRRAIPAPFVGKAADALVEFELAHADPRGEPTNGIVRVLSTAPGFPYDGSGDATRRLDALVKAAPTGSPAWPREDYLNLWVCPLGDDLLGYAQFPGGEPATDGVVIRSDAFGTTGYLHESFNLGRTCVHEVGHWLNLLHVWGDDGKGCQRSDSVADTPNQGGPNLGTPAFPSVSCGNAPHGDMFMNYMDYVDDAAMLMFSRGQVERMDAALAGPRASLAVSHALPPRDPASPGAAGGRTLQFAFLAPRPQLFDGVDWV
jgi:hypothetical protein